MLRKYIIYLALISLLFISLSCGGGSGGRGGEDAPAEATITINPLSTTITVAKEAPLTTYISSFTIVVKDGKGIPLNDVDITISYPWASTKAVDGVVQFYDGNPDGGASEIDSPTTAATDKNGAYTIWFKYWVGDTAPLTADAGDLEYKGDFQVTSGSVYQSATFEVTTAAE